MKDPRSKRSVSPYTAYILNHPPKEKYRLEALLRVSEGIPEFAAECAHLRELIRALDEDPPVT